MIDDLLKEIKAKDYKLEYIDYTNEKVKKEMDDIEIITIDIPINGEILTYELDEKQTKKIKHLAIIKNVSLETILNDIRDKTIKQVYKDLSKFALKHPIKFIKNIKTKE